MQQSPDLMEHIMRLFRAVKRCSHDKEHLPRGAYRLLRVVIEEEGICASDLADKLDVRPSSLTDLLKSMEQRGHIYKVQDEIDSRVYHIYATDKAKFEFTAHRKMRQKQGEDMRSCLTPEELHVFCDICDRLIEHLEIADAELENEVPGQEEARV